MQCLQRFYCDCEDECLRDRWRKISIRFVLHFEHVAIVYCIGPAYFRFGNTVILSKDSIGSEQGLS